MGVLAGKKGFSLRTANSGAGTKSGGNRGNRWPDAKIPQQAKPVSTSPKSKKRLPLKEFKREQALALDALRKKY